MKAIMGCPSFELNIKRKKKSLFSARLEGAGNQRYTRGIILNNKFWYGDESFSDWGELLSFHRLHGIHGVCARLLNFRSDGMVVEGWWQIPKTFHPFEFISNNQIFNLETNQYTSWKRGKSILSQRQHHPLVLPYTSWAFSSAETKSEKGS